jgi:allophanate hydrolase
VTAGVRALLAAYREGATTPVAVIEEVIRRRREGPPSVWIALVGDEALRAQAAALTARAPGSLPLYGVPFAIKDNIDLAGLPTTAGCPAFSHLPAKSATVVQKLLDAGAIAIGKTNLDQFATGLVGTRSPWGACGNAFDPQYISGGSSSGSAIAVAQGQVAFALGTDTAGSGRVPAAFNNIIGYKPSLGLISTQGVVPACRTLDAVSVIALTVNDAALVTAVAAGFDAEDPYARRAQPSPRRGWSERGGLRVAVPLPAQREFFGNTAYLQQYERAIERMAGLGAAIHELDISVLLEAAQLLYGGPWVAERHLVAGKLLAEQPDAVLPVIRQIIGAGEHISARETFAAQYRLQELRRASQVIWESADVLLLPTAATHYRIADIEAEPVLLNSRLGHYTNFVNLLDLAAVAVPAGFTPAGLPFGVSLIAPAFEDEDLLRLAASLHRAAGGRLGVSDAAVSVEPLPGLVADAGLIDLAVCGAHMAGLPLNGQLTSRGAWLVAATRTTPEYRLYALPGGPPKRPGLVRTGDGAAIEVEVWRMPAERFGDFVAGIPSPLGVGRVRTADGGDVCGFLCEAIAVENAVDITDRGGWRAYLAHSQRPQAAG